MFLSLETLTSIIRTGLSILVALIELVNSAIIFLSQMTLFRWLTFLLGSQTVILIALLSWISFFLLMLLFALQWLPLHWKSWSSCCLGFHWISIKFTMVCPIAYDYSHADCDSLCDHLRGVPWEDIFNFVASAAASEFCKWVLAGIDVYIPHRKYQVKPHSSLWFSAACATAIIHRYHFFRLHQKDKSFDSKFHYFPET